MNRKCIQSISRTGAAWYCSDALPNPLHYPSILKDNSDNNPFWNESALFTTNKGKAFRVNVWWKGAHMGCERAQWIGSKMSFYTSNLLGMNSTIVHRTELEGKDDAGFVRMESKAIPYEQPHWWETDVLPEPLRHNSGHEGSHTFITARIC